MKPYYKENHMDPKETPTPAPESTPAEDTSTPPVESTPPADVSVSMSDPLPVDTTAAPAASGTNPGHTLGIVSLILSILGVGLVGIILGAIGLKKSKAVGQKNGLAVAGIVVGILSTIITAIIVITVSAGIAQLAGKCAELGNGVHVENGVTYTCQVN